MAGPKPTLGYPTRTKAAQALRAQGMTDAQIATRIGISLNALSGLFASADRRHPGERSVRAAESHGRTVLFPTDILDRLKAPAAHRGISVNELARQIVDVVAEEGMIDAVLDDEEERGLVCRS